MVLWKSMAYVESQLERAARFELWSVSAGAVWFGALELMRLRPAFGWVVVAATAVIFCLLASRFGRGSVKFVSVVGTLLMLLGGFGMLFFISGTVVQHVITAAAGIMLMVWFQHQRSAESSEVRGRAMAFLMTLAVASIWSAILHFGILLNVQWWILALGGLTLSFLTALVMWMEFGIPWKKLRAAGFMMAVLGAELTIAVWWLSTSVFVGAVIATTALMLMIRVGRHIMLQTWKTGRGRRYLAIGLTIILLMLFTARWF